MSDAVPNTGAPFTLDQTALGLVKFAQVGLTPNWSTQQPASTWLAFQFNGATMFSVTQGGTLVAQANVAIGGANGPTWSSGAGAPAAVQPRGSLYSRTDGAVGSTLYVSQGGGAWNAVAGV